MVFKIGIKKLFAVVLVSLFLVSQNNLQAWQSNFDTKDGTLYLLGDATDAGWDNTAAISMNEISPGIFSITANINGTGSWIKFIEILGQWAPQYGTDDAGTSSSGNLVYRPSESLPDPPAIPAPQTAGNYTITANINDLTYSITAGSSEGLIATDPIIPTDANPVSITFDATQGSGGLSGYTGDVYAHTGVITNLSSDNHDWKYVKTNWGQNTDDTHLTRIETNIYELNITPSIREYYGVPADETILQMAFVFRSGEQVDGQWLEGKTEEGGDIFVNVYQTGLNLSIVSPNPESVFLVGQDVDIIATATPVGTADVNNINFYIDNTLITSSDSNSLEYTYQFQTTGNHLFKITADNGSYFEADSFNIQAFNQQNIAELPANVIDGINYSDSNSVTLVLYAPYKDFVFLIGDFNDWQVTDEYLMNKTPDANQYWLTLNNLNPNTEYRFQYFVDAEIKIADPYTTKVLDPWNDPYIPESVYPNLIDYPDNLTTEIVSVFQINKPPYEWTITDFQSPEEKNLVIYELLIRDFTENSTVKAVTDTLDYLVSLGVNAIELMPFNEFEGNISWGYNPSFYFATDKAYGTETDYKIFIDECHKRGIAVIMDMVLNHSFGQSPFLRLYMDNWQPTAENPWYNETCPHQPWCWGADFNHESLLTQQLVDRINAFWLTEFKIDGFRFDFTKGFTNSTSDSWTYDASRIAILKRMADQIWSVKPNAYVILEHFTENSEEKELANYGMLVWGNMNYNYNEATMGWNDNGKSDFSWISYLNRGWDNPKVVGYMESHDEERLMYKNTEYGNSTADYNIKDYRVGLNRVELAANFFFTIPGPKMIWQFGELGYDISINQCENGSIDDGCRTDPKPVLWNYYDVQDRLRLFQVYKTLINLKENYPAFSTNDFTMETQNASKSIKLNHESMDVNIIGNFDVVEQSMNPEFQHTGTWYEYYSGDSVVVNNTDENITLGPGEYKLFTTVKLQTPEIVEYTPEWENPDLHVRIYPNPSEDIINIEIEDESNIESIEFYNTMGRLVNKIETRNGGKRYLFNMDNLNSGIYFCQLKTNDRSLVKKIIKY